MVTVGIDISKIKIDVCCLFDGRKRSKVFKNNEEGFKELIEWLDTLELSEKPR
jgi:transposase